MLDELRQVNTGGHISRVEIATLLSILIISALICLPGITWGLPSDYATRSRNPDEGVWVKAASNLDPSQGDFDHDDYIAGSFLPYVLAASGFIASLFGFIKIGSYEFYLDHIDELAKIYLLGRYISIFFGVLSVWAFYMLLCRLLDRRAQRWVILLGTLLAALFPGRLVWSHYLSYNLPGLFWIVSGLYALLGVVEYGRLKDYALAGIITGVGAATRHTALGLLPFLFLAHVLRWYPEYRRMLDKRELSRLVLGCLLVPIAFLIIQPYTIVNVEKLINGTQFVLGQHQTSIQRGIPVWLNDLMPVVLPEAMSLGAYLVALVAMGWWFTTRRFRFRKEALLVCWVLFLLVSALQLKDPRVGRVLPIAFLWLSIAVVLLAEIARQQARITLILAVVLVAGMVWDDIQLASFYLRDSARDEAGVWIANHIPRGSEIGFLEGREPDHLMPPLIYGDYYQPQKSGSLYRYRFVSQADVDSLCEQGPDVVIVVLNRAKIPAWTDWLTPQVLDAYYVAAEFKSPELLSSGAWRPDRYMWDLSPTHLRILLRRSE